jgi:hypothetical protein
MLERNFLYVAGGGITFTLMSASRSYRSGAEPLSCTPFNDPSSAFVRPSRTTGRKGRAQSLQAII